MLSNNKTYENNNLRDVQKVFNDGVCKIYSADERVIKEFKGKFYFAYESVGIGHFFQYLNSNNNISIDQSISIPYNEITIDTQDLVKLNDIWYKIIRIQYKDKKRPKYWVLSLQKSQFSYDEGNIENDNY